MSTLVAFFHLSPGERRLVLRCWRLLVAATIGVRLRPLDVLMRAIDARVAHRRGPCDGAPEDALRLCAAAARRVWPQPTCLVTALAGYELLQERGGRVAFVVGGHADEPGFQAHAWLERDEVVVVGAPTDGYLAIWRWPAGGPGGWPPPEPTTGERGRA